MSVAEAPAPTRRKYLCRLLENPVKTFSGTLGGVTVARFKERLEYEEGKVDQKTGQKVRKFTGRRWYEEPVFEIDDAAVAEFRRRLPHAVLRPGAGLVKLDANWGTYNKHTGEAGKQFTTAPSEGDVPLAPYVEIRPWLGSTPEEETALRDENVRLQKEIAELKARLEADDAAFREREARASTIAGDAREVGPRHKKVPAAGAPPT